MSMIKSGLYGLCVADALGVPAECRTREELKKAPITGGLAGMYYGYESVPEEWINCLAAKEIIDDCIHGLQLYCEGRKNNGKEAR